MKIWLLMAALSITLVGCSGEKNAETGSDSKGAERPLVYVANYPLKYFAERISTPLVDVRLPIPAGEDPAFWKPSPEDVLALQQAALVVLNGASYESWLKNVSLSPSKLVDTSANFRDRLIPLEGTTTHSHGLQGEHEHSGTAFTTWLDLTLAVEQARALKDVLAARWPEHKAQFTNQFKKLEKDLKTLDEHIAAVTSKAPDRPVIFSHPVYQYFQRRYDVNGKSVHWEPDEMPDEVMWSEFLEQLKQHSAKWMIWEGKPLQSIVDKLQALGVNSAVVDPCGNVPDDGDFFGIMSQNIVSLRPVYQ
jgi:zinc transport system substrate-binding protein